jgi:hypothetical protein
MVDSKLVRLKATGHCPNLRARGNERGDGRAPAEKSSLIAVDLQ